jgi:lactam utilization protein B
MKLFGRAEKAAERMLREKVMRTVDGSNLAIQVEITCVPQDTAGAVVFEERSGQIAAAGTCNRGA